MRLLIVNFHYIRDHKPRAGIYPLSTEEFRNQIDILGRLYRFISQQELIDMMASDSLLDEACCLVTFDDGFKEQWHALDILERLSIPAACFATTQPIIKGSTHDVHKMHHVYSKMECDELYAQLDDHFHIRDYKFDAALIRQEYRYDTPMKRKIKFFINFVLDEVERRSMVDYLFTQVEPNEAVFRQSLYMDKYDLAKLAAADMLGSHTNTHRPLSTLDADSLMDEISGSKQILEELTSFPIRSISYPFGGPAAVSPKVAEAASRAGMLYGLTMVRGINNDDDIRARMMLRRVDTNDAPGGKLNSAEFAS